MFALTRNADASVVDAGRARLLAVGGRHRQIGQLRVPMLRHEPFDVITPARPHGSQMIASIGPRSRTGSPSRRGASLLKIQDAPIREPPAAGSGRCRSRPARCAPLPSTVGR